ncbi:MAG: hypothetical protein A2X94_10480 [Bdellovibrionales bacterium GWB1_55_8]|nr:MAG: hypothetical protein A2X94_10480 [Bdellovibrionales bacterium GWB1_55_8]
MRNWILFLGGMGVGARTMYLLDPARGRKRRAVMRDRARRRMRKTTRYLDLSKRDLEQRVMGAVARGRTRIRPQQVDEEVLHERIRSKLGRYVSHPHAIRIETSQQEYPGRVTLRGPVLKGEASAAVRAVFRVPGVKEVDDRLVVHEKGDIPALQGGVQRPGERPDFFQESWAPATRLLAGAAGAASLFLPGPVFRIFGITFLARAGTNRPVHELLGFGPRKPLKIHKTMNVAVPVEQVFTFWSDFRNFPRFMTDVYEVRVSDDGLRSYWKVAGPAGAPLSFQSYITDYESNRLLAWRSASGSVIPNSGRVRFSGTPEGTCVDLELSYLPPGGVLAETAARLFGTDPKSRLDESLAQLKTLLERGPSDRQLRRLR